MVTRNRLLIIEDSKEDFAAILRALESAGASPNITHSWNGDEALDSLRELVSFGEIGRLPHVILLDLNLPGTDGRDILRELKHDERFKSIPVVVLTTSTNPRDIADCYSKGVNGYCAKGGSHTSFKETIQAFHRFWLEAAILPIAAP